MAVGAQSAREVVRQRARAVEGAGVQPDPRRELEPAAQHAREEQAAEAPPVERRDEPEVGDLDVRPGPRRARVGPGDELGVARVGAGDGQQPRLGGLGMACHHAASARAWSVQACAAPTAAYSRRFTRAVGRPDAAITTPGTRGGRAGRSAAGPSSSSQVVVTGAVTPGGSGTSAAARTPRRRGPRVAGAAPVAQDVDVELELGAGRRERGHRVVELVRAAPAAAAGRAAWPPGRRACRPARRGGRRRRAARRRPSCARRPAARSGRRAPPRAAVAQPGEVEVVRQRAQLLLDAARLLDVQAAGLDRRLDLLHGGVADRLPGGERGRAGAGRRRRGCGRSSTARGRSGRAPRAGRRGAP